MFIVKRVTLFHHKNKFKIVSKIFFSQVARLQEQLHKEKNSRATLEVVLEFLI